MSSDRGLGPEGRPSEWHRDTEQAISLTGDSSSVTRPDLPAAEAEQLAPKSADWTPFAALQRPPQEAGVGQSAQEPAGAVEVASPSPGTGAMFARPPEYRRPHPMGGKARRLPRLSHAVPDITLDGADFDGLTVRAASLRGDDHRYMTEPRQDTATLWPVTFGGAEALLCGVADGLGSQPNSHMGSQLACWLLRNEFERGADAGLWEDPVAFGRDIVGRIASGMLTDAEARRIHPETLSTTLVAACVELAVPDRPRRAMVLRVGDSTAYMLRDGVFHDCFEDAHKGEDVQESGTSALPGNPGSAEAGTVTLGNDDVLVLCTDGLSNPMHNDEVRAQLAEWWGSGRVPGILEFGWQLGFRAKSYGDDRSVVCVWGR